MRVKSELFACTPIPTISPSNLNVPEVDWKFLSFLIVDPCETNPSVPKETDEITADPIPTANNMAVLSTINEVVFIS